MLAPPPFQPNVPHWLVWGRMRIERIEQKHRSEVERRIGPTAAKRFFDCGRSVRFAQYDSKGGKLYLLPSRFCGFWFCPLCALRRKAALRRRVRPAIKRLREVKSSIRWIRVDLTVPNCEVAELGKTVKGMFKAFLAMTKSRHWPGVAAIVGLEVNRAEDDKAHPHFHCSVAVKAGHFNGRNFWSKKLWAEEWKKALGAKDELRVETRNEEDEEAGDYAEYSQKPPNEEEILWRMRACKEMRRVQRVRYYGEIKEYIPRKKKAPAVHEKSAEKKNRKEKAPTSMRVVDTVTFNRGDDGFWSQRVGQSLVGCKGFGEL